MPTFDSANGVTVAAAKASQFVPQIWSDEIIATFKQNIVVAPLVKNLSVVGKKGDTVYLPGFTRGTANAKTSLGQVTLQAQAGTPVTVTINQHWEYSRLIEDITEKQALASLRGMYTEDAGYALARRVDQSLVALWSAWQGGAGTATYDRAVIGGNGSTLYTSGTPNASAITDAGLRRVLQTLDDADVPMSGRHLVMPPSMRNTIMGLNRFTEQAFVGEQGGSNTIRNGKIGDLYGVDVYVTSLCPTATGAARIAGLFHTEALVLVKQMNVRTQTQYKQEFLADLLTADILYGVAEMRDNAGVAIAVPA